SRAEDGLGRDYSVIQGPTIRAIGCGMLLLAAALHNWLIPLHSHPRMGLLGLTTALTTYCVGSWVWIRRCYRPESAMSLATIFICLDVMPITLAVYDSGGTESLLYPVFAIRLGDFNQGNFRRLPLVFAHVHVLVYVGILLWQTVIDGVAVPWNIEVVTITVL